MTKRLLFSLLILFSENLVATATNAVYIGNAAAGLNDGSSCTNHMAASYFNTAGNWSASPTGVLIGPGTTVHICDAITGVVNTPFILKFQGSGTVGNPITLFWESGGQVTSPACGGICIGGNGNSNLVLDGNGTNPSITCTANGKGLANQLQCAGFDGEPCTNCEFKNLTITNMYVQTNPADENSNAKTSLAIGVSGGGWSVHNSTFDQVYAAIWDETLDTATSGDKVYSNTFNHFNWGVRLDPNVSGSNTGMVIHDNHFQIMSNWDNAGATMHHDGVIATDENCVNANITGMKIYNNLFDGDQGANATAWVFANCGIHNLYVFNNVFNMLATSNGYAYETGLPGTGDSNQFFINNTIISAQAACNRALDQTGAIWENNALQNCYTYWLGTGTLTSSTIDYNAFDSANVASGHAMEWPPMGATNTYSFYQANATNPPNCTTAPCLDTHSITPSSLGINVSTYIPNPGAAVVGAGINLTSLANANGIPELLNDKAGAQRPTNAAWDIGAYGLVTFPVNTTLRTGPLGGPYVTYLIGTVNGVATSTVNLNCQGQSCPTGTYMVFVSLGIDVANSAGTASSTVTLGNSAVTTDTIAVSGLATNVAGGVVTGVGLLDYVTGDTANVVVTTSGVFTGEAELHCTVTMERVR